MTQVAILWHMHQPYYQDLATGEHVLPWVRLHALKDYFGMVSLLEEFPDVRVTFNLVPSLLVQLEDFAGDRARDRYLDLGLKPVERLTHEERAFIIASFFHAQPARMIQPYPRYQDLFEKRMSAADPEAFSEDELRDLQVWQKLVWIDRSYLDDDPRCHALVAKGAGFTEEDKKILRAVELEILNRVIPEYRRAADRGQIETSTSPFYHPILPLLCDTDVYLRTHPHSRMPRHRFQHPEDAREQLERAIACHVRLFGTRPRGLWPSEGSVSDDVVRLAAEAGFDWIATDELILGRTLGAQWGRGSDGHIDRPELLYRPYRVEVGSAQTACVFRDHTLSDLIGFTYSGWDPDRAAQDFTNRLREAGRRFSARANGREALISIILDGENAWEHYEGDGRPFLRALYGQLSDDRELTTVTVGDACARADSTLTGLFPGSWIDADFYVWIGHPDDHRAWGQLAEARSLLEGTVADGPGKAQAQEELLIAEGSDWFWWYGDDHSSEHDFMFDDLFRRHLRNVYRALGRAIPDELFMTNITTSAPASSWSPPSALISPSLDGERSSYFEWLGAGVLEPRTSGGAMHQAADRPENLVRAVHFGFDLERFYVRVDFVRPADRVLDARTALVVKWLRPASHRLVVRLIDGQATCAFFGPAAELSVEGIQVSAGQIAEVAVPINLLGLKPSHLMAFFVSLTEDETDLEQHPPFRPIEAIVPGEAFDRMNWSV